MPSWATTTTVHGQTLKDSKSAGGFQLLPLNRDHLSSVQHFGNPLNNSKIKYKSLMITNKTVCGPDDNGHDRGSSFHGSPQWFPPHNCPNSLGLAQFRAKLGDGAGVPPRYSIQSCNPTYPNPSISGTSTSEPASLEQYHLGSSSNNRQCSTCLGRILPAKSWQPKPHEQHGSKYPNASSKALPRERKLH